MRWAAHRDMCETESYVEQCIRMNVEGSRTYPLRDRFERNIIGAITIRPLTRPGYEFGFALARPWWHRGLMTEALTAMISHLANQLGNVEFRGICDAQNTASRRVLEKCGMLHRELRPKWLVHPNLGTQPRDCFVHSVSA